MSCIVLLLASSAVLWAAPSKMNPSSEITIVLPHRTEKTPINARKSLGITRTTSLDLGVIWSPLGQDEPAGFRAGFEPNQSLQAAVEANLSLVSPWAISRFKWPEGSSCRFAATVAGLKERSDWVAVVELVAPASGFSVLLAQEDVALVQEGVAVFGVGSAPKEADLLQRLEALLASEAVFTWPNEVLSCLSVEEVAVISNLHWERKP